MPKRHDIQSILVVGAGPIIIGQACEFDYSGSQACKALKEEGYRVYLINSNPATIMTDPEMADQTFVEPVNGDNIRKIVEKVNPDAILSTVGGQTGLNATLDAARDDFFKKHNVELIGANTEAINKAEDRHLFKKAMTKIGLNTTRSGIAHTLQEAIDIVEQIHFPIIIRAAYTLGGTGGAIAENMEEFIDKAKKGLDSSAASEIIVEQSILGWKEYELEVMRDINDNVVIICSIENLDPIGVHTGDSITVAPQQTLSDEQYQKLRNMSIQIIREIGVATGGSNIQFAVNPDNGEIIVIEMNPRVSRSSALASKATGFPIAKIAAKLAVGYTLDEIPNDITRSTPASFEPSIDYVVTKIPLFAFEKFSTSDDNLGIQMKSVGETMSIARSFVESFQKAMRGLENKLLGFEGFFFNYKNNYSPQNFSAERIIKIEKIIKKKLIERNYQRILYLKDAFILGWSIEKIYQICKIDTWFLYQLENIVKVEREIKEKQLSELNNPYSLFRYKQLGFSDAQIARICQTNESKISDLRKKHRIFPVYKIVDTCAAEFSASTPYFYSTYDSQNEMIYSEKEKIVIIGGGPNRIGQGIEFDYMCVKASMALRRAGYETIMINSNPETVSTDYDVSSYLFFEPITYEDVMNIIKEIQPKGVLVQLGGQTPLNIARQLEKSGVNILGTSAHSIELAEDRNHFKNLINECGFLQPQNTIAKNRDECIELAQQIGFPLVVRPSFVLGGRSMKIVFDLNDLTTYLNNTLSDFDKPVLLDYYLENAKEIDVDCINDDKDFKICGILEHIEEAGVHSGDSACIFPVQSIDKKLIDEITLQCQKMAKALKVTGLMNVQFAIKDDKLYFLEVNPRGSRTLPFISKASGIPWIDFAAQVMSGIPLKDIKIPESKMNYVAVKEAVMPFDKFPNEDTLLGPEMKSTGEVMGLGKNLGEAFYKSQIGTGAKLPTKGGGVLVSINTKNKKAILQICRDLENIGFHIYATDGTNKYLEENGIESELIYKLGQSTPNIKDFIIDKKIQLILNTPVGKEAKIKDNYIRLLANRHKIPIYTTIWGMQTCIEALKERQKGDMGVQALQTYYQKN